MDPYIVRVGLGAAGAGVRNGRGELTWLSLGLGAAGTIFNTNWYTTINRPSYGSNKLPEGVFIIRVVISLIL